MKQVLQDIGNGRTRLEEVPAPSCPPGHLLVQSRSSVISPGTERMLIEFGRASLLQKARSQPERVREVMNKIGTDGLLTTIEAVRAKLGEPIPLGYCSAGIVVECGGDDLRMKFPIGTRVACNGPHAEYTVVGSNLAARIPDGVCDDDAAFTVLGAIALQGIRLANPTLGETCFVMGLGVVGLLTIQLLKANGCRVIGADFRRERLALAEEFGAEAIDLSAGDDPVSHAMARTGQRGVDVVLITAATDSEEPIRQAAEMCRPRGRIVLVGTAGLKLDRRPFFKKEITFQVSCSYGPGRYDEAYESGQDYPIGHVRWTAQRNFEAVLALMEEGKLRPGALLSHSFDIAHAEEAYGLVTEESGALAIMLKYDSPPLTPAARSVVVSRATSSTARIGVIGTGAFARRVLLPELAKTKGLLHTVASAKGISCAVAARKFGAQEATTDPQRIFDNPQINAVVIATRHDSHADLVARSVRAGKHVFVEKPLAVSMEQLARVVAASRAKPESIIMTGFNRRFSPHILWIKERLDRRGGPACFSYTVNAGAAPPEAWIHAQGGRLVGEGCHFIDTLLFLNGGSIVAVDCTFVRETADCFTLTMTFSDGGIGTIHYWSNGAKNFPKERLTVMVGESVLEMNNFLETTLYRQGRKERFKTLRQDKGHQGEIKAFLGAVRSGKEAISFTDQVSVSLACFAAVSSATRCRREVLADHTAMLEGLVGEEGTR